MISLGVLAEFSFSSSPTHNFQDGCSRSFGRLPYLIIWLVLAFKLFVIRVKHVFDARVSEVVRHDVVASQTHAELYETCRLRVLSFETLLDHIKVLIVGLPDIDRNRAVPLFSDEEVQLEETAHELVDALSFIMDDIRGRLDSPIALAVVSD